MMQEYLAAEVASSAAAHSHAVRMSETPQIRITIKHMTQGCVVSVGLVRGVLGTDPKDLDRRRRHRP